MSSSLFPDGGKDVRLTVTAGSPLAEIFLIDHDFKLMKRSVGTFDESVPPGVYKVKATLGEAVAERLIVLRSDDTVDLSGELAIASPAPFEGTSLTHTEHFELAEETSTAKARRGPGPVTTVLILSRRYSGHDPAEEAAHAALAELSLQNGDGEVVAHVDGATGWDPAVGTTVELDPGPYRLLWSNCGGAAAEQTVVAVHGWQTQVFILEDAVGPKESLRNQVSILMSKAERFDPADEELRLVEEARAALANERNVAGVKNNRELFARAGNPMLVLYGAHLMLIGQEAKQYAVEAKSRSGDEARPGLPVDFDQKQFNEVVATLRKLLGEDHPDVVALGTRATDLDRDSIRPIEAPPMLLRSWRLLIEASNDWPDLVPVHMWRETARQLPLRPFLVWSPATGEEDTAGAEREMGQLMKRTVDEAAGAAASAAADAVRRELGTRMVAPRAAVEELIRSVS